MPRTLRIRKPTLAEFRRLNRLTVEDLPPREQRRVEVLLLHYVGMNGRDIAHALGVHPNTVYADLQAFGRSGVASVVRPTPPGAPARLQPEQVEALARVAQTAPGELGLPWGAWSLSTLRAYAIQHRLVKTISREHLRRVLQKKGSTYAASGAR